MVSPLKHAMFTMKLDSVEELDERQLERLYCWVDEIPLSRTKKNLVRDFSDGVLVAELIQYFLPKLVELHNYTAASSTRIKEHNWYHLNKKVLQKLNLEVDPDVIRAIAQCRPWVVENFLLILRDKMDAFLAQRKGVSAEADSVRKLPANLHNIKDQPEVDQASMGQTYPVMPSGRLQYVQPATQPVINTGRSDVPGSHRQIKPHLSPRNKAGQEMVPRAHLRERQDQLQNREDTIQILTAKISGLEKLLNLKDIRIDDLNNRIKDMEEYRPPGVRKPPHIQKPGGSTGTGGPKGPAEKGKAYRRS